MRRIGRRQAIIWNPRVMHADPEVDWFRHAYWHERDLVAGSAKGRGEALFIAAARGTPGWVLRHYRRGGLLSRLNKDRYFWTGLYQTRAFREFDILSRLNNLGLPVPEPVAAYICRTSGVAYRADLITVAIPDSMPLAEHAMQRPLSIQIWQACGRIIAKCHDLGVWHADLNARNILLDGEGRPWLIDFDRARIPRSPAAGWREENLARLKRSLDKFTRQAPVFHYTEADWLALRAGYESELSERL